MSRGCDPHLYRYFCAQANFSSLDTWQPDDPRAYREMGQRVARSGYIRANPEERVAAAGR